MQCLAKMLYCEEAELKKIVPYKTETGEVIGITFLYADKKYVYEYKNGMLKEL